MKKLISILLSALLLLPVIASLSVSAESTYAELWAEKVAYEKDREITDGVWEGFDWDIFYGFSSTFLLYTEKAKDLTFEIASNDYENGVPEYVLVVFNDGYCLLCNELMEVYSSMWKENENGESCGPGPVYSYVRKLVKTLWLTREEALAAYDKMKNEPESVRGILPTMTDEQFDDYVSYVKSIKKPANFIFEAAFLEDDKQGESLLCKTGSVYFPELGYSLATTRLVGSNHSPDFPIEMFGEFDLTSDEFGYYLANLRRYLKPNSYDWVKFEEGDSPMKRLEYLESVREAQLQAKETGDGAVTSVLVLALVLPTLGALVWVKKKRRI